MDHSELQIHRWRDYIDIRKLRVEPFILFYMIGYSLAGSAVSQLVQDKLCRVDYGQTAYFCVSINSRDFDHDGESIKSSIITKASYITLYRTLISTLPCILWVLFLGPWSDKYVHGRKVIMIAGASAAALEALTLTANAWAFNVSKFRFHLFCFCLIFPFSRCILCSTIIHSFSTIWWHNCHSNGRIRILFRHQ